MPTQEFEGEKKQMMGKLIKDSNVSLYVCLSLFNGPHTAENRSLFNLIASRCELCRFLFLILTK